MRLNYSYVKSIVGKVKMFLTSLYLVFVSKKKLRIRSIQLFLNAQKRRSKKKTKKGMSCRRKCRKWGVSGELYSTLLTTGLLGCEESESEEGWAPVLAACASVPCEVKRPKKSFMFCPPPPKKKNFKI